MHSLREIVRHVTRLHEKTESVVGMAGALALFALFWLLVANIVGRYFGFPIVGTIEFSRELMLFAVFFGLSLAQKSDANIRVGVVLQALSLQWQARFRVVNMSLGMLFASLLTVEGAMAAVQSIAQGEYRYGPVEVPMYPGRIALAFGCLLLVIRYSRDLAASLKETRAGETN